MTACAKVADFGDRSDFSWMAQLGRDAVGLLFLEGMWGLGK